MKNALLFAAMWITFHPLHLSAQPQDSTELVTIDFTDASCTDCNDIYMLTFITGYGTLSSFYIRTCCEKKPAIELLKKSLNFEEHRCLFLKREEAKDTDKKKGVNGWELLKAGIELGIIIMQSRK